MYRVRGKWLANVGRMYRVRPKQVAILASTRIRQTGEFLASTRIRQIRRRVAIAYARYKYCFGYATLGNTFLCPFSDLQLFRTNNL